jgi:hypothetical protein
MIQPVEIRKSAAVPKPRQAQRRIEHAQIIVMQGSPADKPPLKPGRKAFA